MALTPQEALGAVIGARGLGSGRRPGEAERPPLITIARDEGCGAEAVGRGLAEALGVDYFDRDIVERIAAAAHEDKAAMALLDETDIDNWGLWLSSLTTHTRLHPSQYMRHLINIVLYIASTGGVIMGRGAHLILRDRGAFRLRLVGSVERCARRIAAEEGLDKTAAAARVRDINQKRARFVWEHFKSRTNEPHNFDVIVNTDGYDDTDDLVHILLAAHAAHEAGRHAHGTAESAV